MKIFLFTILLVALTSGLARTAGAERYPYRSCAHSNTKECRDARDAFARHHNGLTPEQWYQQYYQGQPGLWRWENAEGDEWFQGRQGHWYQEAFGWLFRGDDGDDYRQGENGWGWITGR